MAVILPNNAETTLATAINASETSLVVADGSVFPSLSAGQHFYATLVSTQGTLEIVKVTARSGNILTVTRGAESTTPNGFAVGTRVEARVTAASVEDKVDDYDTALRADLAASSGSSLVGYIQGGSGASARTAQTKLREIVSVKDFGAVGDGVTDDTAAIQAAIASGAGSVYFPSGDYVCDSGVSIRSNLRLHGDGATSILRKAATLNAGYYNRSVFYAPVSGTIENVTIDRLSFVSTHTAANTTSAIVNFDIGTNDISNIVIRDNYFSLPSYGSPATLLAVGVNNTMNGVVIANNVFDDIANTAIATNNNNNDTVVRNSNIQITGNTFKDVLGFCVTIAGGTSNVIVNDNTFSGTNSIATEFAGSVQGGQICNNVFSGSYSQLFYFSANVAYGASTDIVVSNNVTQGTVTANHTLQGIASLVMEGNKIFTSGQLIFNGVDTGITAFVSNNWFNQNISSINGAVVTSFNNYIGSTPPANNLPTVYTVDLPSSDTDSTALIEPGSTTSWRSLCVRVRVVQVKGDGSGGAYAESIIAFRYINSVTAIQINKIDVATSAGLTLSVAYGIRNATITATSTIAEVRHHWSFDIIGQTTRPSITVSA